MDNLIYRQAALDMVNHLTEIYVNNLPPMLNKADVYDNLRLLPSADVQPVIRCKDCKWCVDADGLMCKNVKSWVVATEPSFGCVYGERKDDEQNGSID